MLSGQTIYNAFKKFVYFLGMPVSLIWGGPLFGGMAGWLFNKAYWSTLGRNCRFWGLFCWAESLIGTSHLRYFSHEKGIILCFAAYEALFLGLFSYCEYHYANRQARKNKSAASNGSNAESKVVVAPVNLSNNAPKLSTQPDVTHTASSAQINHGYNKHKRNFSAPAFCWGSPIVAKPSAPAPSTLQISINPNASAVDWMRRPNPEELKRKMLKAAGKH